ncbi:hypothetical protein PTKIN_Ptkin16aG0101100 [Pterospermum kingtungense]
MEDLEIEIDVRDDLSLALSRYSAVGCILTNRRLNRVGVMGVLWGIRVAKELLCIKELGMNTFLLSFTSKEILSHALDMRLWSIMEMLTKGNTKKIGKHLEDVIRVEDPNECHGMRDDFLMIRVAVNIKNSLVVHFWVPRWGKDCNWADFRMIGRTDLHEDSDEKNVGMGVRNKLIIENDCKVRGLEDDNRGENRLGSVDNLSDILRKGCARQRRDAVNVESSRVVLGGIGEGSLSVPLSKDSMFEGFVDTSGIGFLIDNKNVVEELVNKSHEELKKEEEVVSEDVEDDNSDERRKGVEADLLSLKGLGKGSNYKLIVVWLGGMVLRKVMVAGLK